MTYKRYSLTHPLLIFVPLMLGGRVSSLQLAQGCS